MQKKLLIAIVAIVIVVVLVGAIAVPSYLNSNNNSPSPTPTSTGTPSPTTSTNPTATPQGTISPTVSPTNSPTATATPTPTAPTTVTVVDHLNRTVIIPTNLSRVVSLHSISTQIVYALGAESQLYAVDKASTTNKVLQKIDPKVTNLIAIQGESNTPNVEEIVNLSPDLVIIAAYYPDSTKQLEAAGLRVIAFNFHNMTTTSGIELIGKALGKEDAAANLCSYYNEEEALITSRVANLASSERPTVIFVSTSSSTEGGTVWSIGGNQAYQHTLITRAGGTNIGENLDGIWFTESPEQLLQWNPQYIFTSASYSGFDTGKSPTTVLNKLKADAVLSELDAVKNNNFYYFVRLEFSTATNCPESIIGLEMMAKTLHPNLFADINLNTEVKEFFSTFYHCQLTDAEVQTLLNPGT